MKPYNFLQINKFKIGEHYITPLREQDIFKIKDWRNSQFDILRQKNKLTNEDQIRYYQDVVKPTFSYPKPLQMLFSFLLNDECIGYGGLTNIDWESKQGELSFLLDPIRADNHALYEKEFSRFLDLMKQLVFEGLQFNRIFTETYDIRPFHISILEKNGFTPEGRLREHVLINGSFVDSLFHGFIKENYVAI